MKKIVRILKTKFNPITRRGYDMQVEPEEVASVIMRFGNNSFINFRENLKDELNYRYNIYSKEGRGDVDELLKLIKYAANTIR